MNPENGYSERRRGRPRIHPPRDPNLPKRPRGRPHKDGTTTADRPISRHPTMEQIEALRLEMASLNPPPETWQFREWLKYNAERDLFFFTKWIYYQEADRRAKLGNIHIKLCEFITDYSITRRKLLMMPMGHLKTSFCSHSLPLHIIIQKPDTNIYFPGRWGCDQRIMLGNENEAKCLENLSVIRQHLESNVFIAWLWPHVCWENPGHDAPVWRELKLTVPRNVTYSEPTLTAIGAETGIVGRHYDVEVLDDIAGTKAGDSWQVMDKVRKFKKTARSRLHSRTESIEIGIGTHQSADDVYVDWQKDSSVDLMIRSIIEDDRPLWPENPDYTMEGLEKMRAETGPILWALWYMNRPTASTFTAMDWNALREFRWDTQPGWMSQTIEFNENEIDAQLQVRKTTITASPLMRLAHGLPLERHPNRAMSIRRAFGGQSKPDASFIDHMRDKHGCPLCQHKRHEYECTEPECPCRPEKEIRPWEIVLKGPF